MVSWTAAGSDTALATKVAVTLRAALGTSVAHDPTATPAATTAMDMLLLVLLLLLLLLMVVGKTKGAFGPWSGSSVWYCTHSWTTAMLHFLIAAGLQKMQTPEQW